MQKWSGQSTPSLQEIVDLKLVQSGEKERLKELLVERLVECGWKDEMKAICREFARKKGRDTVTVHELVKVITPKGKAKRNAGKRLGSSTGKLDSQMKFLGHVTGRLAEALLLRF
ncbi:hypothetical protein SASPL_110955 [Salvia splendens]|uniref:Transcription and mRNA export factor ENY2 n=1 Tax=Salvia splendens TaxID=180675 RepID=A0A8X8Y5T9_SALSN|nr:hypothetical protein SASPL_110955 [Salvia splendens]